MLAFGTRARSHAERKRIVTTSKSDRCVTDAVARRPNCRLGSAPEIRRLGQSRRHVLRPAKRRASASPQKNLPRGRQGTYSQTFARVKPSRKPTHALRRCPLLNRMGRSGNSSRGSAGFKGPRVVCASAEKASFQARSSRQRPHPVRACAGERYYAQTD